MSATYVTVQGTVKPDDTLELDKSLPLPAGRVQITVHPAPEPPNPDRFWAMMEQIWADLKASGHVPRSVEEIEAERQALRDEWEEQSAEREQIHYECERQRRQAAQPKEPSK